MAARKDLWTRDQLFVAIDLYCRTEFGKFDQSNPAIVRVSKLIGRTPSALAMKLSNLASLDKKITGSGRSGLTRSSDLDKIMWAEVHANWDMLAVESQRAMNAFIAKATAPASAIASAEVDNETAENYEGESRPVTALQRMKQSLFRETILSGYKSRCCMSNLAEPKLLIASHIVPWSGDKSNRLNPRNGLCLSALHDRAFDQGLITVTPDYLIKVSRRLLRQPKNGFLLEGILKLDGARIQ
ncbi:MAG: HNH endonuclease, partial [Burkholderiales bacterium]|nr:HNH endonuclease [Burkholderiales bacterium]